MTGKRDNAADRKSLDKKALIEEFATEEERQDFLALLESGSGRRVLWNLMSFCRIYQDSFTGNSSTFYYEGRRSVGLHILGKVMSAKPESYLQMMKESKEREESDG